MQCRYIICHSSHKVAVEPCLQSLYFFLSAKYFFFVLLKLRSYVALGIDKGLLAYPLAGHLRFMSVRNLYIVPENIVVPNLERRYTRSLHLACLNFRKVVLALIGQGAEFVEFFVDAGRYNLAA